MQIEVWFVFEIKYLRKFNYLYYDIKDKSLGYNYFNFSEILPSFKQSSS